MQHFTYSLLATLSVLSFTDAALTKCKQDSCFNQMAFGGPNAPNRVARINDCKRALVLAIDDDIVVTKTVTSTAAAVTNKVTAIPRKRSVRRAKRDHMESIDSVELSFLEERDTFVVKGLPPPYTPSCKTVKEYAIACLCYGVKVRNSQVKTVTTTAVITPTTTLEVFISSAWDGVLSQTEAVPVTEIKLPTILTTLDHVGPITLTYYEPVKSEAMTTMEYVPAATAPSGYPDYTPSFPAYEVTTMVTQVVTTTFVGDLTTIYRSDVPLSVFDSPLVTEGVPLPPIEFLPTSASVNFSEEPSMIFSVASSSSAIAMEVAKI